MTTTATTQDQFGNFFKGLLPILTIAGWGVGSYFASQHRDGIGVMNALGAANVPQATLALTQQLLDPTQTNPTEMNQDNPLLQSIVDHNNALQATVTAQASQITALTTQVGQLSSMVSNLLSALNGTVKK